ncbi:type II toxin-antitoxin system CcdA family antitoxin [Pantoea agglomerans]|uniref:type II toxin-antitoxin system CcdA family antitoxin n=1 Tax=Enterobacter agglomerans TaxID=549 RepID=UPI0024132E07|nr:type II toxin-antitoxin system CcdA family antitoxin [Pantoea agglomerans]
MHYRVSSTTQKKRTNVSINEALLEEARACGINISALLEQSLHELLLKNRKERYLAENKKAFASHNAFTEAAGLFSDDAGVI